MPNHTAPAPAAAAQPHQLHHFVPLGWRVMRCTCKGWVLTTHPCRHSITTALVKIHVRATP